MKNIILIVGLSLALLAGAVYVATLRDAAEIEKQRLEQEEQQNAAEGVPDEAEDGEYQRIDTGGVDVVPGASQQETVVVAPETTEEEQHLVSARQWAYDANNFLLAVGKSFALSDELIELEVGEEAPNLHEQARVLHERYELIDTSDFDRNLRALLKSVKDGTELIISDLPAPPLTPTKEELIIANERRKELRSRIEDLYAAIEEA